MPPSQNDLEDHRHRRHRREQHDEAQNGREGEQQRHQIEPEEAALLLRVIGDVERVHHRLHRGIGTPQRHETHRPARQARDRAWSLRGDAHGLLADDRHGALGKERRPASAGAARCSADRRRAIERDQHRDGGKQRQKPIEGDAARHRQHAVAAHFRNRALQDLPPAAGCNSLAGLAGAGPHAGRRGRARCPRPSPPHGRMRHE